MLFPSYPQLILFLCLYNIGFYNSEADDLQSTLYSPNGSDTAQVHRFGIRRSEASHCRDWNRSQSKSLISLLLYVIIFLLLLFSNFSAALHCRVEGGSIYSWVPRDLVFMETPDGCSGKSWSPSNFPWFKRLWPFSSTPKSSKCFFQWFCARHPLHPWLS